MKYYLAGLISLATFAVYIPALLNGFVEWDDSLYVFDNNHIQSLNAVFFKWAFTTFHAGNWHPLTWISHALDYAVWGLNPMGHHLTNNVLHAANTFLVVLLVMRLIETGTNHPGPSLTKEGSLAADVYSSPPILGGVAEGRGGKLIAAGVTGLLFGLHPIHVESVAWVAERKDLLCALFYLLSIMAYVRYAGGGGPLWPPKEGQQQRVAPTQKDPGQSRGRYLLSLCFFVLALMSKPMAVSMPLVLFLLDWYPLERVRSFKTFLAMLPEKVPFIVLSLASSAVTLAAQKTAGAMEMMEYLPLSTRMLVASKSLILYLWKMVFSFNLSPYYPYPPAATVSLFSPEYFPSVILASGITVLCLFFVRKKKAWPVFWGYFGVTLVPVLGIVQVGGQAMADRYAYLPSLSPFLITGVVAAWLSRRPVKPDRTRILARCGLAASLSLVFGMAYLTVAQIGVWKDGINLWSFVIQKEPDGVPLAYNNRGLTLSDKGRFREAIEDFDKAIALRPAYYEAYSNRGMVFEKQGQFDKALADFNKAISLSPFYKIYYGRGILFEKKGDVEKAIMDYNQTIAQNPAFVEAMIRLGILYGKSGALDKAIENFDKAVATRPNYAVAYANRGFAYSLMGQYDLAIGDFTRAIKLDKNDADSFLNRGKVYLKIGKKELAIQDFRKACDMGSKEGCGELKVIFPEKKSFTAFAFPQRLQQPG